MINIINPDQRNVRQSTFREVIQMVAPEFKVKHKAEFITLIEKDNLRAEVRYQLYEITRSDDSKCYYLLDNFGSIASMPSDSLEDVMDYLRLYHFRDNPDMED